MRLPGRLAPHLLLLLGLRIAALADGTFSGALAAGTLAAGILAGTVLTASPVSGQSLADVARKEEERRKTIKQPSKVYSNQDLHSVPPVTAPPPEAGKPAGEATTPTPGTGAQSPTGAGKDARSEPGKGGDGGSGKADSGKQGGKPDGTADRGAKDGGKGPTYWSGRKKELQGQLDRDETFASALQSRISALTTDFVNRDDPAQKAVIARDKQKALDELSHVQKAIQTDRKALADLEEEARRSGVPPGWLRH